MWKNRGFKMHKILLILFSVFIIAGCTNKTESEFKELVTQAETHYNNADYMSSLEVYKKALTIKEDVEVRKKAKDIEDEITTIKEIVKLHSNILDISTDLKSITTDSQLVDLSEGLISNLLKIEDMETSKGLAVDQYIETLKASTQISLLKLQAGTYSLTHSTRSASKDAYTDGSELNNKIKDFMEKYPLPEGFSSFK